MALLLSKISLKPLLTAAFIGLFSLTVAADSPRPPLISNLEIDECGNAILMVKLHSLRPATAPRTFRFALDTGSTTCVIDTSVPPEFFWEEYSNLVCRDYTGTSLPGTLVLLKKVELDGLTRESVPAARWNLQEGMVGKFQDRPVDGILGMSFLRDTRFILDIPLKKLEWWGAPRPGGTLLQVVYGGSDKLPYLALRVNHRENYCLLDTGAGEGLALPWDARPPGSGTSCFVHGLAGVALAGEVRTVDRVEAGDTAWRAVEVAFYGGTGIIGMNVFSAGPTGFDFVKDQLTLPTHPETGLAIQRKPVARQPFVWDRSGKTSRLVLEHLDPESAMAKAGFQVDDEIVQVAGLESGTLTRKAIQELVDQDRPERWLIRRKDALVCLVYPLISKNGSRL